MAGEVDAQGERGLGALLERGVPLQSLAGSLRKEVVDLHPKKGAASEYRPLVLEIVKFFQTGNPPVANEDTLEIMAFMDAAQRSKDEGGRPMQVR